MKNVKLSQLEVKTEGEKKAKVKVSEFGTSEVPTIKEFDLHSIQPLNQNSYSTTRARFGSLASTDSGRANQVQKDRRFSLNPLLREPLSIEQEEKKVIDQQVLEHVQALSVQIHARAELLGYEEGLKRGQIEANNKFQDEGRNRIAKIDQLIREMENAKIEIYRANEKVLVDLVFRISKLLLLRDLSSDRDFVARVIRELITRSGARENITVRISEDDSITIDRLSEVLFKSFGELKNLNIETSKLIKVGGCQVSTEWNTTDTSIEAQLDAIYKALLDENTKSGVD